MSESGLFILEKESLKGRTIAAFRYWKGCFGERRLELIYVGLGGRTVQGSAVRGRGRTWLREMGCTGG